MSEGIDRATAQWYVDTALVRLLARADELVEAGGEELLMGALLDDAAVLHHQDQVCVPDGGQSVGDDKTGAVAAQCIHRLLKE